MTRALATLLATSTLALACKSDRWGERAPFTAAPAPASWSRPDVAAPDPGPDAASTPDPTEARLAEHVYGDSAWPCTGHPSCERRSPPDGTLGTAAGSMEYLDPNLISETEGFTIALNAFEGLLNPARRSGGPLEQGVAERWSLSADRTTYTFHLRADARWSNGRAVTAHDFVYSWLRLLDPATGSQQADNLYWIAGAEEYNQGKTKDPGTVAIKALDDRTLEVRLRCPVAFWPAYLVAGAYLPVPREAIEAHGPRWTEQKNIVTNGPYHIVRIEERDRVELARSETYWDKDNVRIPRVVVYHGETEAQQLTAYETGQIQWARQAVDPSQIERRVVDGAKDLFIDPWLCTYFYMFNVTAPPFDDVRVRRAFAHALDRETLVSQVSRGMQIPADGPVPSVFDRTQGFPGAPGPRFDPGRARALLAEAGYPNGKGFPEVKILYNTMELHKRLAEFLARQLQEVLGVAVRAENLEWKSLLKQLRAGDFAISRFGACGLDTPFSFLENYVSTSPRNDMRYDNPTYDKLVSDFRCAPTEAEALAIGGRAEAEITRDLPILPVFDYTRYYLRWPVLRGLEPHLEDHHPIKYMWWGDRGEPPAPRPMPPLEERAP
ncbi:MAG: peptide ABC transporter substrate-binding protein [Deltaproteobacteria bacterium]|nr:peptide ABC transporter substrate-binding protein [Deltaproteobacteria bacterium]